MLGVVLLGMTLYVNYHREGSFGKYVLHKNAFIPQKCECPPEIQIACSDLDADRNLLSIYVVLYWVLEITPLIGYLTFYTRYILCLRKARNSFYGYNFSFFCFRLKHSRAK